MTKRILPIPSQSMLPWRSILRDYAAFRSAAIRYWERRRVIYNIALVPPAFLSYCLGAAISRSGDDYGRHPYLVAALFILSAFGANICYSMAYALEFLFGSDDPASGWLRFGRTTAFVSGVLFGMVLAFFGGRNIALMEFYYR